MVQQDINDTLLMHEMTAVATAAAATAEVF
jgi:hypothetical protein